VQDDGALLAPHLRGSAPLPILRAMPILSSDLADCNWMPLGRV
jgi:hypothetical protein